MIEEKGMSAKSNWITWHSGWTPCFWKFSKKSFRAFSSRNQTWKGGIGSKEEDPEPGGFRVGVDLRALGAIAQFIWERERERERERENTSQPDNKEKKRKEKTYAWTCDVQNLKTSWVKTQSKSTNTQSTIIKHTSKMHETLLKCNENTMHEHITSNQKYPTQKFHKNLKNPKIFKNPKT